MTTYTQLAESGAIHTCLISELKETTLKSFNDEDNKTLLNKYLNLLVDCALSGKTTDFEIQFRLVLIDNYIHLDIYNEDNINDFCFIGKFCLSEPFNEKIILDRLNDKNLVNVHCGITCDLTNFVKMRVLFTSEKINQKISKYLEFIAEDVFPFVNKNMFYFSIRINEKNLELSVCHAYLFLSNKIVFTINLEEDFNCAIIVDQLNISAKEQLNEQNTNFLILLEDGFKFLETLSIVDQALHFENKLTSLYIKNPVIEDSIYDSDECWVNFLFFSSKFKKRKLELDLKSKSETIVNINITPLKVHFYFEKKDIISENFTWTRTDDVSHDVSIIHSLFILYFEKICGYKIIDLKREFQLMEMEAI